MENPLTDVQVRVLGALIEKEMTTPLSYPLTINALTTACNQKSNRHPVVSYDDHTVVQALDKLRDRRLVETVFPGSSRTAKYRHNFAYEFGLNAKLQALLGVLMLRGPQTAGELRTRTERMTRFDSLQAVTETLEELIDREEGALVVLLPPGPGQKERRYMHLLAGEVDPGEFAQVASSTTATPSASVSDERIFALEEAVARLQKEMAELRDQLGFSEKEEGDS